MNDAFPVYTMPNECQDCYKCVRHCSCKAIRIVNSRAAVIPELCVVCGECVKVCPAHAKKIRSDISRVKFMLANKERLYASIAPSYAGYFKNVPLAKIVSALKKLGFEGVSETALGAQLVSSKTADFLAKAEPGIYISSACPSAVEYIGKYHPEFAASIVPVVSPVMAHARMLHKEFGDDIKVIFIGPCAAKKLESDRAQSDLALSMTFPVIENWIRESNIDISSLPDSEVVPRHAEEGRAYSLEGGMNDTLRDPSSGIRYIAVSGLADIDRLLSNANIEDIKKSKLKLFIEVLACSGGCVNGPAMPTDGSSADVIVKTLLESGSGSSIGREVACDISDTYKPKASEISHVTEDELREALESVGKFSPLDELNCGGCGYNTCREFASAKIQGKAEAAMCLSYLRKMSQKTSNALIKFIPAAVVIVRRDLTVLECNRNFAKLGGEDTLQAFDACGTLAGAELSSIITFTDLFESVLSHGGEIERFNQTYGERIYNISVFSITPGQTAGAVIQDVTESELHREQIAEKAREVIRKNVLTVQKIARDLGEHMADTEILLKEVAGSYGEAKK